MKFLAKRSDSGVLSENLTYKRGRDENNRRLRKMLLAEQKNFCAYTEKYVEALDTVEVEHFNSAKKYNDDYYNYYAVIRNSNQYKKDEAYRDASFFNTLFFQDSTQFNARIRYVDGVYEEIDENDAEARDLIDFLGFNHPSLHTQRNRYVTRLKNRFEEAGYTTEQKISHFKQHPEDLSFITAIEYELQMDLSDFIT